MTTAPTVITYRISGSTGFYRELNTLLIALQGVAVASAYTLNGAVHFKQGDYVTVEARHSGWEVRLPLVGPIEAALANRKADEIHLTVVQGKTTSTLQIYSSGFADFADSIFLPFVVGYFERHRAAVGTKFGQDRTAWPASWQMGWAVRNAASHGGQVFERSTQKPVHWRGLAFGPSDEPARKILAILNGGDLLALMVDMEEEYSGAPLPRT